MLPEPIKMIPAEMLKLIPFFGGDKRQLSLFIRQCEYVISNYTGSPPQDSYVMHLIMSRLVDNAAALISEREDISTWDEFKELLTQHFGDPRSEDCIAIELESMKIRPSETYLDFCNRIQSVRSVLISKVNLHPDVVLRKSKITIYNNTSLNVFLYNLPENMVRIVRLKAPKSLEEALGIVMEEVNFHDQYNMRNKIINKPPAAQLAQPSSTPPTFKFGSNIQPSTPTYKFGIPPNQSPFVSQRPPQPMGFKPQLGYRPPFGYQQQMTGMRPQQFGMRPQQFGMRPQQFGAQPQRFGVQPQQYGTQPQQFGMRPQQFGMRPQYPSNTQFGYRPMLPNSQANNNQDVSMRTAPPLKMQQGFRLNELAFYEPTDYVNYDQTEYGDHHYCDYFMDNMQDSQLVESAQELPLEGQSNDEDGRVIPDASSDVQNFHMRVIADPQK